MTTTLDISEYTIFPFKDLENNSKFILDYSNNYIFQQIIFKINDGHLDYTIYDNHKNFSLLRNRFNTKNKNIFIICSKNNGRLLEYCLKKLKSSINIEYDILIVDDGSDSDDILKLSDLFETSYLRINSNDTIFNYSIINNIAASYARFFDKQTIIFYNNDLWPSSEDSLYNFLAKHQHYKSDISGCRLVYPIEKDYEDIGKPQHLLGDVIHKVYDTIQHGGIHFVPQKQLTVQKIYYPDHTWRFYLKDNIFASLDSRCFAVTGAIQIIGTDTFYKLNGFNQSLSGSFQDIDLCIKGIGKNLSINYIGSEYMYHAESLTIADYKKNDIKETMTLSDHILWGLLWESKLPIFLGYGKYQKSNTNNTNQ
jgi:hypothetical protein